MKKNLYIGLGLFLSFLVLFFLLLFVDVKVVNNTNLGLSTINQFFDDIGPTVTAEIEGWDKVSDFCILIGMFLIVFVCGICVVQFFVHKYSIYNCSSENASTIFFGLIMVIIYIVFGVLIKVNYQPRADAITNEFKSSFPSSHVLVVTYGVLCFLYMCRRWKMKTWAYVVLCVLGGIIVGVTFIGRYLAHKHWITDVVGGLLIASSLYFLMKALTLHYDMVKLHRLAKKAKR